MSCIKIEKKLIGTPPTMKRSLKIAILCMPMKKRMNQTTRANSTVVLGTASVEFGSSAR